VHDKTTLLLSLVAFTSVAFVLMRFWLPSALETILNFVETKKFWVSLCGLFLATYLLALIANTTYPGYLEHIEPNIASVSFVLMKGAPLYHDLDSTQRYSFPYGPMAYLPYTLALRLMGANVLSLKIIVLLANLLLVMLLWRCYRQLLDPAHALLVIAAIFAYLLVYDYVFQVRGDILVIFSVALGLYAILVAPARLAMLLLALACGFAFDIKVTALFYFLPLYSLLLRRCGWRLAMLAAIGAAMFALTPFLLPGISAAGYLDWLRVTSREPLVKSEALRELKLLPFVFAPLGLFLWRMARRSRGLLATYLDQNRTFLIVLSGCLAVVAVTSLKIGAGPHHFLPFYPIIGYVCADVYNNTENANVVPYASPVSFIPLFWTWVAIAVLMQLGSAFPQTVSTLLGSRSHASAVASDLETVMKSYSGKKIEMGYGGWNSKHQLTYFRPALVFAGNPFTIDALALGDMQLSGLTIPRSTLEYLQGCKTQIWLIPRDEPPFSMPNVYSLMAPHLFPLRPLFSDEFRRIFFQQYRKQGSSQYFDIWECPMVRD